jgi:hypothetical protein
MTITDKLKLELFVREQVTRHQDEFYTELARILEKIQNEHVEDIDTRGKPNTFSLRWQ